MNKRQRKKYLKQKGEYISNGDLMDFDVFGERALVTSKEITYGKSVQVSDIS